MIDRLEVRDALYIFLADGEIVGFGPTSPRLKRSIKFTGLQIKFRYVTQFVVLFQALIVRGGYMFVILILVHVLKSRPLPSPTPPLPILVHHTRIGIVRIKNRAYIGPFFFLVELRIPGEP